MRVQNGPYPTWPSSCGPRLIRSKSAYLSLNPYTANHVKHQPSRPSKPPTSCRSRIIWAAFKSHMLSYQPFMRCRRFPVLESALDCLPYALPPRNRRRTWCVDCRYSNRVRSLPRAHRAQMLPKTRWPSAQMYIVRANVQRISSSYLVIDYRSNPVHRRILLSRNIYLLNPCYLCMSFGNTTTRFAGYNIVTMPRYLIPVPLHAEFLSCCKSAEINDSYWLDIL